MPFSENIRQQLAAEVGGICSADHCRTTVGLPQSQKFNVPNVGDAAHIKGAQPGAARFDPYQPAVERESESNGIWLCGICHRRADRFEEIYDTSTLHKWKQEAIQRHRNAIAGIAESDERYVAENELIRARKFLKEHEVIENELYNFLNITRYPPFGATQYQFPNVSSKINYFGIVFREHHWNNRNRLWAFAIKIRRWEDELLRICYVMAKDRRMTDFFNPIIVDVGRDPTTLIYVDPLMQGVESYVDHCRNFESYLNLL